MSTEETDNSKSKQQVTDELKAQIRGFQNFFTKTKYFQRSCDQVFKSVDYDNSNYVSSEEAYIAVLFLYIKLAPFLRGLVPPTLVQVQDLMKTVPHDGDVKQLDVQQFRFFCTVLLANLSGRILLQVVFTFFLTPIITSYLSDLMCGNTAICSSIDKIPILPSGIPQTLLATLIAFIVVPWLLGLVDHFFATINVKQD